MFCTKSFYSLALFFTLHLSHLLLVLFNQTLFFFYSSPSSHIEEDYHCDYKTQSYDAPHNSVVSQPIYSPEEETNHHAENASYHSNYKKSVFENFAFCERIVILRNSFESRFKSSQSLGISELVERHD